MYSVRRVSGGVFVILANPKLNPPLQPASPFSPPPLTAPLPQPVSPPPRLTPPDNGDKRRHLCPCHRAGKNNITSCKCVCGIGRIRRFREKSPLWRDIWNIISPHAETKSCFTVISFSILKALLHTCSSLHGIKRQRLFIYLAGCVSVSVSGCQFYYFLLKYKGIPGIYVYQHISTYGREDREREACVHAQKCNICLCYELVLNATIVPAGITGVSGASPAGRAHSNFLVWLTHQLT